MVKLLTSAHRDRADLIAAPISAFESETQALIQRTTPYSERAILHVLAGIVLLALLLMAVIKLDRVVSGEGRILPSQGSLFIQPLDRAIVTQIVAHAGDVVKKGEVLASLDPTFAQADLSNLEQKRASADALVRRLTAEQTGQPYVADPASPYSVLQASIWAERQAQHQHTMAEYDARIQSATAAIDRSRQGAANYRRRSDIARQVEQAQLELERRGYGSKLRTLSATDARVEMTRMTSENATTAAQAQHELAAVRAQRAEYVGKWRSDVATQLVTAENELAATTQGLAKAAKVSDLSTLVAPADAVVLKVGRASIGSVIDPSANNAEPLFTLTPLSGPLVADIRIRAKDIGFIRPGDTVRVKLDAYRFTSHGVAKGVIKGISAGSFTTSDDGQVVQPYYRARVAITDARLRNVPANFRLVPGLTITGEVLVGRRTILAYLFDGALRTGAEAMREP
ncbi:HlyD family type I secretion periplasmic adaptor subunit [Phenylobacterium hankyongense]|uniref:Membrane fusion protein (MFP) family protein n=1 Tax=Phenylobacterium hankyongense TaxID=1813876 RepID=A0A328B416_9CAUL|nr:HlyD family type I secretion periplasmic adaptor subunit [Phenylobacterium hankyongense]RAK61305.1 HlyD family type I secretion periplasmic adaptor subunit [Phenylobacterium hankyongense]